MPTNIPTGSSPAEEAVRTWLKKWNKSDAPPENIAAIVAAVSGGAESVRAALVGIGITIKVSKWKEFQNITFSALTGSLASIHQEQTEKTRNETASLASGTIADFGRHECVPGPGFPMGRLVIDPETGASETSVREVLECIDLDTIYNTCIEMTGMEPPRNPLDIHIQHMPDAIHGQGGIALPYNYLMNYYPDVRRVHLDVAGSDAPHTFSLSYKFLQTFPAEARGVIYHELGHLWTQKILSSPKANIAFAEGFAELMRTAAAKRENATWEQANGGSIIQVLSGNVLPCVIPIGRADIRGRLNNICKYVVCSRLKHHLGDLEPQRLGGLTKACSYTTNTRPIEALVPLIQAIEHETGVTNFAQNFMHDPALYPGGLQQGEIALAMTNEAKTAIDIYRTEVLERGERNNWTLREYQSPPVALNESDFSTEPIRFKDLPFKLHVERPDGHVAFTLDVSGGGTLTPQRVLHLSQSVNIPWKPGKTKFYYEASGEKTLLLHTFDISERDIWNARQNS